jgi:hypothetical protein
MRDDNDRLLAGTLPSDPFADAIPIDEAASEADSEAREYRPFPVEALPEPVCSFVTEAADAIGCDHAYVALSSLAGLAASIGNARRIKLKGSWYEPAVLWTAIVGESGTLKSPALDVALAPLRRLQAKAIDQYRIEKKAYDEELERYLQAKRSRKRSLLGEEQTRPDPPVPWRILCSDITVEALAGILEYSPRGLLLVRDELSGWIRGFDQYKKTQGADAAHYLSMHRAGDLLIDRKTNSQIVQIRRAAVSITGGIQPRILKRALGEEHLDNGLAARLLLAMPPRLPKRWTDEEISLSIANSFSELYSRLLELDFMIDAEGNKVPIDLPLTASGRDAWIGFFNRHGLEQAQRDGDLAAAFSKLEGYCARFALVIHLTRCQSGDPTLETEGAIDSVSIEAGVALTTWFAYETERVYATLGIAPLVLSSPSLDDIIRRHGGRISVRDLMHASRQYRGSSETARAALQQLVDAGLGAWIHSSTGRAGRPSEMFEIMQEGGNNGNGNNTLPFSREAPGHDAEIAASCDQPPSDTGRPYAGNEIPSSVTGEEVSLP